MDTNHQQNLFKAMENPRFYPHPTGPVTIEETHISRVFLTGDFVYKVKKSLDLGFLDFSTLEKRHFFCEKEVSLNRRLTRDIYLGVVPITLDHGRYSLGKTGSIVEYAVKMRQLDESWSLQQRIKTQTQKNSADIRSDVIALGEKLGQFYLTAPTGKGDDMGDDGWKNIFHACNENFNQTQGFTKNLLDEKTWKMVRDETLAFLKARKPCFMARLKSGKVKDCHGDLRCGHIYFTDRNIQIIDCIEFNDSLRHIDIINDLAFLLMDLDFCDQQVLGDLLLDRYLEQTGDLQAFMLLDFYKCYRAFVRCKVNAIFLASTQPTPGEKEKKKSEALKYLDLARDYALRFSHPGIFVIHGLPATGKSTMAKALGCALEVEPIRSDIVRKQMFGISPHDVGARQFKEKIYTPSASDLTYERLIDLAQQKLEAGTSVILDATFSMEQYRKNLVHLAKRKGISPVFIECRTHDDIIKKRLLEREHSSSVSDARIDHFKPLKNAYQPLTSNNDVRQITIDTTAGPDQCIRELLIKAFGKEQRK
ncbi:conserved hypothetical protein [Desulforapulum autotrophicum HRM2]|uniref:Aminoglycoside phosphotransferase domain-containing protein n=1 Tax=Desulforapulum autotrophicum (strain ATCC 43914 / DSM 3382 / VKM B-1955 / HRM2) TaxID=177437 RepID=C0QEN7_DESAH|nr:bifunctional aminoglycoside phosphotransferase/ATP-binding protein [Desulforapulum autotrophicum]ACN15379.1 conserved hypothetical protein [Desulforapulum autotrophicum HRM2]